MQIAEYVYNVVKEFMAKYPALYANMQTTNHNEPGMLSKWHLEGSVWTHTLLVMAAVSNSSKGCANYKELVLAALLHDIGKVYTREIHPEKKKVTFYGHPGVSTFLAKDILDSIDPTLTFHQKINILYLINYHQLFFALNNNEPKKVFDALLDKFNYPNSRSLIFSLNKLREADNVGRVTSRFNSLSLARYECLMKQSVNTQNRKGQEVKENQPEAVIMIGLPGSGKSTYAHQFYRDYTLVSRDAQIEQLAEGMPYSQAFKTVDQKKVDVLYEQVLSAAIQKKENLVIDKTNLTYKGRQNVIKRLRSNEYDIKIVVLMPSLSVLQQRNRQRKEKIIPQQVINTMMKSFEMPFPSEGKVEFNFNY